MGTVDSAVTPCLGTRDILQRKARLGQIQQFWFAEPDTEPNWVVRLVRHDTLCRYVLTLKKGPWINPPL